MILAELFLSFARIGCFVFGGGYGMVPLLQQAAAAHGWMDADTLYRCIAICESTPGPIAVNMATFIGAQQAGLAGSLCATFGVVLPSFVIILLIAALMKNFSKNPHVAAALRGIRPVVAGMITATGLCFALKCLNARSTILEGFSPDLGQLGIAAALGVLALVWRKLLKRPFSPIGMIVLSAIMGIVVYGI